MTIKTLYAASAAAVFSGAMAQQVVMYSPGGDNDLIERIDPIVNPNSVAGHVHNLFGASNVGPNMTYESLQESDCTTIGSAGFEGNAADKSLYWHPSLYMEANDGSGFIHVPTSGHKLYYLDIGYGEKRQPFQYPEGFRMVAGDSLLRQPADNTDITLWKCSTGGSYNFGDNGGFPTGVSTCEDYPGFFGSVEFPHCWNGNDFDPTDPGAHMSYPEGHPRGGTCPSSHPIRLPHLFMENFFDVNSIADKAKPDSFMLSMGDPTGFGSHADFFNGWDDGALPALLEGCPQGDWGNADAGICPGFRSSGPASSCKLSTTYEEEVFSPGNFLPGCNPIQRSSFAQKMLPAALGEATDKCDADGSGGSLGSKQPSGGSGSGSGPSNPVFDAPEVDSPAEPVAPVAPVAPSPVVNEPAADGGYAVTVTAWTTVDTYVTATPGDSDWGLWERNANAHLHRHRHPHGRRI